MKWRIELENEVVTVTADHARVERGDLILEDVTAAGERILVHAVARGWWENISKEEDR